ncbi:MAG: hypothetical protein JO092_04245 [Candidatus Eremiobacteraeota bacterium]|nr:hypothetical protein [Candidatus Eremiobacteraeota bacterium]
MPSVARFWQRVVFALCLLGVCASAEAIWATYNLQGDFTNSTVNGPVNPAPFLDRFDKVDPGTVAERAGIRSGDELDLRLMTPRERYWERNEQLAGVRLRLPIVRNGAVRWITVTPVPYTTIPYWASPQAVFAWAFWVGSMLSLLIAALLVWRRPESVEVRLLALTLALINLGEGLFPINEWLTPWATLDAAINVVAQFLFCAGIALLAAYAMLFGRPVSLARRVLTVLAYAAAALSALIWTSAGQGSTAPGGALGIVGLWQGSIDVHAWLAARPALFFAFEVGPCALALLCAIVAVFAANGAERTRVAWATGSLAVLYLFGIALVQSYFTSDVTLIFLILNAAWIVAPLGLTYALLNRRLLDVGFVLNRAAVFTAVSLIVVGVFTLLEWALGGWLHTASRVANVAVSAAIALGLGLSLHQIHKRVDRVVDSVFFRKRHEDEQALKRFAREVAFITDPHVVLARAMQTLRQHADASSAEFALHDGSGHCGEVDENDPALVTLRASHEVVDLRSTDTALEGEFAYPMLCRGHLVGALVLGPKSSGEPYAPDESAAIAQLAHAVGVTIDLLAARSAGANGEVLSALHSLETLTLATNEALRALPEAIAERLREAKSS